MSSGHVYYKKHNNNMPGEFIGRKLETTWEKKYRVQTMYGTFYLDYYTTYTN